MIQIRIRERCVDIEGHAGVGAFGADIVCAAASMLAYTLATRLEEMETDGLYVDEGHGSMRICWAEDRHAEREMFRAGALLLAQAYPGNVAVHREQLTVESET